MVNILHLCCCLGNPPIPFFFFPYKHINSWKLFCWLSPEIVSKSFHFLFTRASTGLGDQNWKNLMRLRRLKGTVTTHSQAGRFHTISMHPDPKENCSKFHPSQRTAVTVDSNAEKRGVLHLLVARAVLADTFSWLRWGICSALLPAVRLWKEASGQNKYF